MVVRDTLKALQIAADSAHSVCRSLALLATIGECLVYMACDFSCLAPS